MGAPITWKTVEGPSNAAALDLLRQSLQGVGTAISGAGTAVQGYVDDRYKQEARELARAADTRAETALALQDKQFQRGITEFDATNQNETSKLDLLRAANKRDQGKYDQEIAALNMWSNMFAPSGSGAAGTVPVNPPSNGDITKTLVGDPSRIGGSVPPTVNANTLVDNISTEAAAPPTVERYSPPTAKEFTAMRERISEDYRTKNNASLFKKEKVKVPPGSSPSLLEKRLNPSPSAVPAFASASGRRRR
mgnify:CR=1 FL=1